MKIIKLIRRPQRRFVTKFAVRRVYDICVLAKPASHRARVVEKLGSGNATGGCLFVNPFRLAFGIAKNTFFSASALSLLEEYHVLNFKVKGRL